MRRANVWASVLVCGALSWGCSSSDSSGASAAYEASQGIDGLDGSTGTSGSGTVDGTDGTDGAAGWTGGDGADASDWVGGTDGIEVPAPAPDNSGDDYEPVGTNPFVMAVADPLSTFAADVDTASYDIFRRDVSFGMLPQAASVRLEEYVNAFDYDYEPPAVEDGVPFSIHLDGAPSPYTPGVSVVRVGIKGLEWEQVERKRANIVFLVDISGSMKSAAKLPLVQTLLTETVKTLSPDDTVSIVTYAGATGVALPPTPVSQAELITATIESFTAGGSTAGAAGIDLAYQQAELAFVDGGINHVVLCTDGDFNVGTSTTSGLITLIEEKRKTGVTLTALGFGSGNLNDSMMERVTNAGNGVYAVITNEDHAIAYAWQTMLQSMHFVAQDLKLQVVFNPDKVLAYRLLGYEINAIADDDFKDDTIDAGEIGANHSVTALYEVIEMGGEIPVVDAAPDVEDGEPYDGELLTVLADELVRVEVRWKVPGASEDDPAQQIGMGLTSEELASDYDGAAPGLRWASAVAAFAEILKGSPYGSLSHLESITHVVETESPGYADREEFAAHYQTALGLLPAE